MSTVTVPASGRPRVLSGMQPTSDSLHLGNYLGALRQWVALQQTHDPLYCVVDLHALTVRPDPQLLRSRVRRTAAQYIAAGVDPEHSTLFVQSHVHAHTELCWVLTCVTGYGEAARMTQFKDKSARQGEGTSLGILVYPVLMAADILLYQAQQVPVGEDQRQHLELTRDLAQRFNAQYGRTFVVPEAYIPKHNARVMDLQNPASKMSKSGDGVTGLIEVLDDPKVTAKRIKSAVTDTGREIVFDPANKPGVSNLLAIYSALTERSMQDLEQQYQGKGYGDLKKDLAEVVNESLAPFRSRFAELMDDPAQLDAILADGAEKARALADATMERVRTAVGLR